MERIIELAPDLVISYEMWLAKSGFEGRLVPHGIAVARICCYRVNTLEEDIRLLGKLTGREARADAYAAAFRQSIDLIQARLKDKHPMVRVYAEGYGDYSTTSRSIGASQLLACAGVENIAADLPGTYPLVSPEWVVARNPAVVVKAASTTFVLSGYKAANVSEVARYHERIVRRPAWHLIDAVRDRRVYLLSHEIWTGPRASVGIQYIAKWCYPDVFADIDPEMFHRQWLWQWHRKPLIGVYVFPPADS